MPAGLLMVCALSDIRPEGAGGPDERQSRRGRARPRGQRPQGLPVQPERKCPGLGNGARVSFLTSDLTAAHTHLRCGFDVTGKSRDSPGVFAALDLQL